MGASIGSAVVGVADHGGWAVLVTALPDGTALDRRRVELVPVGLPRFPHHHEGQSLPLRQAVDLVERVRTAARQQTADELDALAASSSATISGIASRKCVSLPPTVSERISDYRAQTAADSVMYRELLAHAAKARGWWVHWYEPDDVLAEAARALRRSNIDDLLQKTGIRIGPPWQKDHKVAMAAAIAASALPR